MVLMVLMVLLWRVATSPWVTMVYLTVLWCSLLTHGLHGLPCDSRRLEPKVTRSNAILCLAAAKACLVLMRYDVRYKVWWIGRGLAKLDRKYVHINELGGLGVPGSPCYPGMMTPGGGTGGGGALFIYRPPTTQYFSVFLSISQYFSVFLSFSLNILCTSSVHPRPCPPRPTPATH